MVIKRLGPNEEGLTEAAALIRAGKVVAFPTDTIYGLGADPFNADAVTGIYQIKGRPETQPILLLIADLLFLKEVASAVSAAARRCIERFWPGPLSLLLPVHEQVPKVVTAGSTKICVRLPKHDISRRLAEAVGGVVTATSANRSGEPPARNFEELSRLSVAAVLYDGEIAGTTPSTVFDPDTGKVIREGTISRDMLRSAGIFVAE